MMRHYFYNKDLINFLAPFQYDKVAGLHKKPQMNADLMHLNRYK